MIQKGTSVVMVILINKVTTEYEKSQRLSPVFVQLNGRLNKYFSITTFHSSAPQSKNAVSTIYKQSRYIHLMSNLSSIHFHTKRLYVHMFDIVDTSFSYGRGLIVCSSLQEFSKTKESTLCVI